MNKKIYILYLIGLVIFGFGCNKVEPTTATIFVRDANKVAVSGVVVTVYPSSTDSIIQLNKDSVNLWKSAVTGGDGKVNFDYSSIYKLGQGGGAVLSINAKKGLGPGDTLEGTSFIVLTPEKANEAIVTITKKEVNK